MNEQQPLSLFYFDRINNYHSRTDILKLLMMPVMFIVLLGLPGQVGGFISTYFNFVPEVFFILFGFFALVPDPYKRRENLEVSVWRALIMFGIMLVVNILVNVIYLSYYNILPYLVGENIMRKRTLFNFLVLCVWPLPVGNSIWFVQSLLYSYLFFLFVERKKLTKVYFPLFIVLIIFMLATGEFASLCGFPYYVYDYIPGGFITRALPYMMIGMYLHKHVDKLPKIPQFVYLLLVPVGIGASVLEFWLLGISGKLVYFGHTIGFGITAIAICCFALAKPKVSKNFLSRHGDVYSKRMYVLCQPVAFFSWLGASLISPAFFAFVIKYVSVVSLVICFGIAVLFSAGKRAIGRFERKMARRAEKKEAKKAALEAAKKAAADTSSGDDGEANEDFSKKTEKNKK